MSGCFCPGHISCVFQPFSSLDPLVAGSRGFGIRLSLGAHCTVRTRMDGDIRISIDGDVCQAPITRRVVETLGRGRGFDVEIENDLPVSQGFGMSAAGSLSVALCVADELRRPREDAVRAAHMAEVLCGGGLGDVAAIASGHAIPVRMLPGMPPYGRVDGVCGQIGSLTLAVLGPKMVTGSVLRDPDKVRRIRSSADDCIAAFLSDRSISGMYVASNRFSSSSGLESAEVASALRRLRAGGYHAGMCMLGNSVFTDAPRSVTMDLLGLDRDAVYRCSSCSDTLHVTRTV